MTLDFNPLEFFVSEIKNDQAPVKINAVNELKLIASALGPTRVVNELIPQLNQVVHEEPLCNDDEFLFCMAKQYAVLADYCGGREDVLIEPLEHLACQEETVIRDQAIESLRDIVDKLEKKGKDQIPKLVADYLVPTLNRLAAKSDFFTARVSACALFPTVYRWAPASEKANLRQAYNAICADDTPMVRRAAAHKMKEFVSVCDKQDIINDMMGTYKLLSQEDTQDTIRVACVHTTLVVAKMLTPAENEHEQHTVQIIKAAGDDRSWRVRLTVAKNFDQLCMAFGSELTSTVLIPVLKKLMEDHEIEVRKEAVRIIEPCLAQNALSNDQLQKELLPCFQKLCDDPAQPVRAALASVLGPVVRVVGPAVTQSQLLQLISDLMKDELHDVRLNIVSHAGLLCEVVGVDNLVKDNLLNTIQSLIMDNHWRIRQSVVEQVPKLAKKFGVDMYQAKLEALFLSSLRDSVHSVRQAAIMHLQSIAETFGTQWTVEHLLPKITEQYVQSAGYASRVTTLQVLPKISVVMNESDVAIYIVPLLVKATKDTVPNVRFCACRNIMVLVERSQVSQMVVNSEIRPALQALDQDTDCDVLYYAKQALAKCR